MANKNIFKGELKTYSLSDGVLSAVFETIAQVIDNDICRVRLQGPCNNTLFDATCGLVALTYRVSATGITKSTDGKTLTSASFGTKPDNYFAGGTLVSGYQERIITSHVGNVITINRAISGLGTTAYVYPGCDKSGNTCVTKFLASNIANFTGMPFIPLNDPETTAITTNQTGV